MVKPAKTWLTTVAAAGLLTLVFALLAMMLYARTEAGVVRQHSRDQTLLTQWAAVALRQRVDSYRHSVEVLAAALQEHPEKQWEEALSTLPAASDATNLLLLRPDGTLHYRQSPQNAAALEAAVLPWRGAREPVLTNPFPPGAPESAVVLLVPLASEGRQVAQLGAVFPFASLLETLFPGGSTPVHLTLSLLDDQGTVLANTHHPEMVGRRIPPAGESCLPCHASFDLERRMLKGEAGVDRIQVGQEPLALVSFTPVALAGRRWSLSLAEPYSAITADTRQGFRAITLLLGFSLLVGIIATSVTLQYRVQRRRAEERAQLAERRAELERQLRQSEQLAAIGKMTSQIAHEINTPLAALGLNVSYLHAEVNRRLGGASPEIGEVSNAIVGEIERLKRVVNDYLRFSRLPQPVLAVESLRAAVESFVDFIGPEAQERGVVLQTDLGREPAYALLDTDLFRQAFLNLVRNSFEAMPEGGGLRIHLERTNAELVLRVEDTGRGVPPDILPHIFDPFFTTKKDGTGLGLAHARRVVEQHGGTIACQSPPGEGTTFTVRLPAAPAPAETSEELRLLEKGH